MSEDSLPYIKEGNLYFCKFCKNVMMSRSVKDVLRWNCSIACASSKDYEEKSSDITVINDESHTDEPVLLSMTSVKSNIQDYPLDDNVVYNPTLLRIHKECAICKTEREMIIFRKNEITSENILICSVCKSHFDQANGKLIEAPQCDAVKDVME